MGEYFKFLAMMSVGLCAMAFCMQKLIDALFTTWDPFNYYRKYISNRINERIDEENELAVRR